MSTEIMSAGRIDDELVQERLAEALHELAVDQGHEHPVDPETLLDVLNTARLCVVPTELLDELGAG